MGPVSIILVALLVAAAGIYLIRRGRAGMKPPAKSPAQSSTLPQMKLPPTPNGDAVDKARDDIINALWTVLAALETRRQEDKTGGGPWGELSAHVLKYVSAIRTIPRSIPVIVVSTVNAVEVLELQAERGAGTDAATAALKDMVNYLASATVRENAVLTEILGRKISEEEARHAQTFIDSLEWDNNQKAFVSSGMSPTVH